MAIKDTFTKTLNYYLMKFLDLAFTAPMMTLNI